MPSTSAEKSGKLSSERTLYVAFCEARRPSWWMRRFLKKDFSHCMILQPFIRLHRIEGRDVFVETCFSVEFTGYAIVQQSYYWIDDAMKSLPAADIACVWARNGWRVVKMDRVLDEEKTLNPVCNMFSTCVTLAKCLMGVSCMAQTPYQLYRWMKRNGGKEI